MARVFTSHSSVNNTQAMAMKEWLRAQGWDDVFLDLDPERGIKAGERWQQALEREAAVCDFVLFLISPAWAVSRRCFSEFTFARALKKRIFAILIEPTSLQEIPEEISAEWQMVDLIPRTPFAVWTWTSNTGEFATTQAVSFSELGLQHLRRGLEVAGLDSQYSEWPPAGEPDRLPYGGICPLGANGRVSLEIDESLGRIRGSIDAAVQQAFRAADADRRIPLDGEARRLLLRRGLIPWLAGIDPETGSARRRVAPEREIPEESRPLIDLLVEQRLLTRDRDAATGETTLEPAHEALLRQWSLLDGWLREDHNALAILESLKRAATEWDASNRHTSWLIHSGSRLTEAATQATNDRFRSFLSPTDHAYLEAARVDEDRRVRRERTLHRVTRFTALAALIGLFFALYQWRDSQKQIVIASETLKRSTRNTNALRDSQARFLTDRARLVHESRDHVLATLIALETWSDNCFAIDSTVNAALQSTLFQSTVAIREQRTVLTHENRVSSAVFSPDGKMVLSASDDSTARVWEATSGREISVLKGHQGWVLSAVFSPDGKTALTASSDTTARMWDATSGKELAVLRGHEDVVPSAVFSPDAKTVLTASWDRTAMLWDATSGKEIAVLRGHEGSIWSAVFSPDGKMVLTTSLDNTAKMWDAATGIEIAELKGHELLVNFAVFSPDGRTVLTASDDKTARLWEVTTGKEIAVLKGHDRLVKSAVFSPNGRAALTTSDDKTARLWEATSGKEIAVLKGHESSVTSAVFSPDGKTVLTTSADKTARLWSATSGIEVAVFRGHGGPVNSAVLSPDGATVLTASEDNTAKLWDATSGTKNTVICGHEGVVYSAVFSPDGRSALTASADKTARVWDVASGTKIAVLNGHESDVFSAVYSRDGRTVLTASLDETARVWEATSGREIAVLRGHEDQIRSAVFAPDGKTVLTASSDETARVWEATSGKEIAVLGRHDDVIWSAVFSPDGKKVLTKSRDGTTRVWDASSGKEIALLTADENHANSAALSPDGKIVLTIDWDHTIRMCEATSGKELALLKGHQRIISSAVFSADGRVVLTASWDHTARVWDAFSGKEIAVLRGHEDDVNSAVFSPDGKTVLTASVDGTARIWWIETDPAKLVAVAKSKMPRGMTRKQREEYFLSPEPPRWYITGAGLEEEKDPGKWKPLWPYQSVAWREWQVARDRGEEPKLPEE